MSRYNHFSVVFRICMIFVFMAFTTLSHAAAMKATVETVSGKVDVQETADSGWKALKSGDMVPQGALVRTGPGASCMLKWGGGNVAKIPALSNIRLDKIDRSEGGDENSSLMIEQGKVFAHVKKLQTGSSSFELKTPTAVAGVRGSDIFGTNVGNGYMFGVTTGALMVSANGESALIEPGFSVTINDSGAMGDIMPIPPEIKIEAEQNAKETNAVAEKEMAKSEAKTDKKQEKKEEKAEKKEEKKQEKDDKKQERSDKKENGREEKTDKNQEKDNSKSDSRSESKAEEMKADSGKSADVSEGKSEEADNQDSKIDEATPSLEDAGNMAQENMDSVLEDNILNETVEDAENLYKTGTVEIYISAPPQN